MVFLRYDLYKLSIADSKVSGSNSIELVLDLELDLDIFFGVRIGDKTLETGGSLCLIFKKFALLTLDVVERVLPELSTDNQGVKSLSS